MSDELGLPGLLATSDAAEVGVLTLTLDRPARRNAVTDEVISALSAWLDAAEIDETVRVVHLTATGEHFCSGFDLSGRVLEKGAPRPRVSATQRQMRSRVNRLMNTLHQMQTPVVVSARGYCYGLGLNLVAGADFAVVDETTRLKAPFVDLGFTPDSGASWLLPQRIGLTRAREMVLLGREITGVEAEEWGLVHRCVSTEELTATTSDLLRVLANAPTVALGMAKRLLNDANRRTFEEHLALEASAIELSSRSEDFKEGMRARREKRDPEFEGR